MKSIPFDSLCLASSLHELQSLVGGRLQRVVQPDPRTLVIGIYAEGKETQVLLSCSPKFARLHRTARRPASIGEVPELSSAIRKLLDGARVKAICQVGFDRIAVFEFASRAGDHQLIAELTGKHANLILVGPDGRVAAAAHSVLRKQSVRPIFKGIAYAPPPFPPRLPIYEARNWEEFSDSEGSSSFLRELLLAEAGIPSREYADASWERIRPMLSSLAKTVQARSFRPVSAGEAGAYPVSVAILGYPESPVVTYSEAADRAFSVQESACELEAARARLLAPLRRVLLAREVALQDLEQAAAAGRGARGRQTEAELILAYASTIEPGQTVLETVDYEGQPMTIALDPELSPKDNAARLFEKAKKAKARAGFVEDQRKRLSEDRTALIGAIRRIEDASALVQLREEEGGARSRNWLRMQSVPTREKSDRPYEGHRIRELAGPGGVKVLYGENATSNDYLTQRVARPNDYWLHVRGAASAHVVVVTQNRPERIGKEALEFAARVAIANSGSKHSGYVTVDYTLRKYVRKPRGASPGAVTYSNEKSLNLLK